MGGCGTHLLLELYYSVGFRRAVEPTHLLLAMVLARKEADAPCRLSEHPELTATEAVRHLAAALSVVPPENLSSEQECFRSFGTALACMNEDRLIIGHEYRFSHTNSTTASDGKETVWTVEDRDDAQDMLERATAFLGIDLRQAALLRNPVDIHYSHLKRYYTRPDSSEITATYTIGEFFSNVIRKAGRGSFPVVRYEDICRARGDDLCRMLAELHFSPEDIARLDTSVVHGGNLEKWRLYPPRDVRTHAKAFGNDMEPFGYTVRPASELSYLIAKPFYALRKYRSEFRIINRILAGDFSVDAAFSRHKRSIPARIYFRLSILFPAKRKNIETFYRGRKNTPQIPTRRLREIFRQLLTGGLK